ncbi:hypothetical protein Acr_08g0001650 [Actinidia rufa]|uniref:Uncharacterized protein n=1 Tax=Actinidia rufa TaxID=165716 RepID=A0A7J0F0Q0_9ERIC|nr:hypothetical protein Acr_08g0001650 [Actinidia rufa]
MNERSSVIIEIPRSLRNVKSRSYSSARREFWFLQLQCGVAELCHPEDMRSTVVAFLFFDNGCTAGGSVLMVVHKRFGFGYGFGIGDNALGLEILSSQRFIELLALEGLELLTDGL